MKQKIKLKQKVVLGALLVSENTHSFYNGTKLNADVLKTDYRSKKNVRHTIDALRWRRAQKLIHDPRDFQQHKLNGAKIVKYIYNGRKEDDHRHGL